MGPNESRTSSGAESAVDLIRSGRHRDAVVELDATLERDPSDHAARYHRGMANRQLGLFDEAMSDLDLAIQTQPDHRDSRIERALVALDLGEPTGALLDLDAVLARDPEDAAALRIRRRARSIVRGTGPVARIVGVVVAAAIVTTLIAVGGLAALAIVLVFLGSLAIHELGHLAAARRAGLPVAGIWLWIGPRLIWARRRGIDYGLRLLPLGAYVRLRRHEETPESWRPQVGFFAAGPLANLALAVVLALVALVSVGVPNTDLEVQRVEARGIARLAGVEPGDHLISIDSSPIRTVAAARRTLDSLPRDEVIQLNFRRGSETPFGLAITGADRRLLGLHLGPVVRTDVSLGDRAGSWWNAVWRPEDLLADPQLASVEHIRNPVRLLRTADAVDASPWLALLTIAIAWNGPIGLLNLVPIPPFDGGQILRVLLRRRRLGR